MDHRHGRGLPCGKSRLSLGSENSLVLPTSTLRKSQKNKLQQHLTFRPPFQRRQNPKTASLVAPRTERNSFPCKSAGGEAKQSGGLFWRGEPSPGVPRIAQIARFYLDSFSPVTTFIVGHRHAPACTESRRQCVIIFTFKGRHLLAIFLFWGTRKKGGDRTPPLHIVFVLPLPGQGNQVSSPTVCSKSPCPAAQSRCREDKAVFRTG